MIDKPYSSCDESHIQISFETTPRLKIYLTAWVRMFSTSARNKTRPLAVDWKINSLVFCACANVRVEFAPVDSRITHGSIVWIHVYFCTHAALQAELRAPDHFFPPSQISFGCCKKRENRMRRKRKRNATRADKQLCQCYIDTTNWVNPDSCIIWCSVGQASAKLLGEWGALDDRKNDKKNFNSLGNFPV